MGKHVFSLADFPKSILQIFAFKAKLKLLKGKLRTWHHDELGGLSISIKGKVDELDGLDIRLCKGLGVDTDQRKYLEENMWRNMRTKENMIARKSRVWRIKEGDENT